MKIRNIWLKTTLTMAQGGDETLVFHNSIFLESAEIDFSFDTSGMRIV